MASLYDIGQKVQQQLKSSQLGQQTTGAVAKVSGWLSDVSKLPGVQTTQQALQYLPKPGLVAPQVFKATAQFGAGLLGEPTTPTTPSAAQPAPTVAPWAKPPAAAPAAAGAGVPGAAAPAPQVPPGYESIVPEKPDITASFLSTTTGILQGMATQQEKFMSEYEKSQAAYTEAAQRTYESNQQVIQDVFASSREQMQSTYESSLASIEEQRKTFAGATVLPQATVDKLMQNTVDLQNAYSTQMTRLANEETAAINQGNLQYLSEIRQQQADTFNTMQQISASKLQMAQTMFEIGKYPEELKRSDEKEARDMALKYGVEYNPASDTLDSVFSRASAVAKDFNEMKAMKMQYENANLQSKLLLAQIQAETKSTSTSTIAEEAAKGNLTPFNSISSNTDKLVNTTNYIRDRLTTFSQQPPSADISESKLNWSNIVPGINMTREDIAAIYQDSLLKGEDYESIAKNLTSYPIGNPTESKTWLEEIDTAENQNGNIFAQLFR